MHQGARFEILEHTADVGIRAYGRSLPELYSNAARALLDIMVRTRDVRPAVSLDVHVAGRDRVELLVAWLHEIIFRFETTGLVFGDAEVRRIEDGSLDGVLRGEPLDSRRHVLGREVKAVTYHGARVDETRDGWIAEVILDI